MAVFYERLAFSEAAQAVQKLSTRGNLFMEEQAPWTAFKKASSFHSGFTHAALQSSVAAHRVTSPTCLQH